MPTLANIMPQYDPYEHLHMRLNPDGSVTRLLYYPLADPKPDPASGEPVLSKDCVLNNEKNTFLRIYLPVKPSFDVKITPLKPRLPILIYFHGCCWVRFRANNPALQRDRENATTTIAAMIIVVDCRLPPESRLPAQYEDAVDTLLWVQKQALDKDGEEWIKKFGDFSSCFLYGTGSGGNIVFNTALRALDLDLKPLKIEGLVLNQPMFGGQKRTDSEIRYADDQITPLSVIDVVWELALPKGSDRDHVYCNPMLDGPHRMKLGLLPKCLVIGFGMSPLIDRQEEFVEMLVLHGVQVEAHFDEAGFHRIELVDPQRLENLFNLVKQFVHGDRGSSICTLSDV